MSKPRKPHLPPIILEELEGLPWELVPAKRHWRLLIGGDFVAIWPYAPTQTSSNAYLGVRADIRRWKMIRPGGGAGRRHKQ